MAQLLSFVHASDLHLDRPVSGLTEIPHRLRERLVDAPYLAAENVFTTALKEKADFVVLAGDVLDLEDPSPRAVAFLVEQFERLQDKNIAVYWAGGGEDRPKNWPDVLPLPENVHVFPAGRPSEIVHRRRDRPVAALIGHSSRSRQIAAGDFSGDDGVFALAVAHGEVDASELAGGGIDYWALGGRHERKTLATQEGAAHYPGTPQGRSPEETGARGCLLVRVDATGLARVRVVPCDAFRWCVESPPLAEDADEREVEKILRKKTREALAGAEGRDVFITWKLEAGEEIAHAIRRGDLADELVAGLNKEFGDESPAAWTVGIDANSPAHSPEEFVEEESILGDFLRSLRQYETGERSEIDVTRYLPVCEEDERQPAVVLRRSLEETREKTLGDVAALAMDLLRGPRTDRSRT